MGTTQQPRSTQHVYRLGKTGEGATKLGETKAMCLRYHFMTFCSEVGILSFRIEELETRPEPGDSLLILRVDNVTGVVSRVIVVLNMAEPEPESHENNVGILLGSHLGSHYFVPVNEAFNNRPVLEYLPSNIRSLVERQLVTETS